MDLGKPLEEHGAVDITDLLAKVPHQTEQFWSSDRDNRVALAGDRPGNAVFFYNDAPTCIGGGSLREVLNTGFVNVLRYKSRPLFDEVDALIDREIQPKFPDCDRVRVQLAELPPGQVIEPHVDLGILTRIHRLHVPLITHEGVKFFVKRQPFFLEPGKLYDLNNAVNHSVENNSDVMRIHLLVDMLPNAIGRARYHDSEDAIMAAVAA